MRLTQPALSLTGLTFVLVASQSLHAQAYTPIIQNATVWPQPQELSLGSKNLTVSPNFHFECSANSPAGCPDPLPAAFNRYIATGSERRLIFVNGFPSSLPGGKDRGAAGQIEAVSVLVRNDEPLEFGVDESYKVKVTADGHASIEGHNQWGALRGMESLSQLIWWNASNTENTVYNLHGVPLSIVDEPRFHWRGVLIDSSRHFLSKKSLYRVIDSISFVKYNVLHWHLTDDQSWPLKSQRYPNFTKKAAYRPETYYDHQDVQDIVNYAYDRGIIVVPEIDMPAHADSWGLAYPDLTIQCPGHQTLLDPTDTDSFNVYRVFENLMDEFVPFFNTSGFFHIGGDEVKDTYCWEHSSKVQSWMKDKGFDSIHEVRNYFEDRMQKIVQQHKKRAILWEEVYDDGFHFDSSSIVNAWLGSVVKNVTSNGLALIYNYGWYLDKQNPPGKSHYLWEDTWTNFWLNEPLPPGLTPKQKSLVLGGEASQWGEQVTGLNVDSRIWPRACGAAERLWSPESYNDVSVAWSRLAAMQCHLVQRNIGAGPVRPSRMFGYCPFPEYVYE